MTYFVAFLSSLFSVPPSFLVGVALEPGEDFFVTTTSSSSSLGGIIITSRGDGVSLTSIRERRGVLGGVTLVGDTFGGVRVGDCFTGKGLFEMCIADIVLRAAER